MEEQECLADRAEALEKAELAVRLDRLEQTQKLLTKTLNTLALAADHISFKVTFAANGGTGGTADLAIRGSETAHLPECGFTAPEGKEFAGWSLDAAAAEGAPAGTEVNFVSFPGTVGDVAMHAVWKDAPAPEPDPGSDPGSDPDQQGE